MLSKPRLSNIEYIYSMFVYVYMYSSVFEVFQICLNKVEAPICVKKKFLILRKNIFTN
jgi:hypothetical protein